ncbi:unnamed protein product [Polarella glacialis]|uniref:Uncharacterized protein n=1 Tax=Polarella glacialis TaxID=89957 RepID=A0A813I4G4_POLGL|nr:unnamed protein product [Polarella glacialis]
MKYAMKVVLKKVMVKTSVKKKFNIDIDANGFSNTKFLGKSIGMSNQIITTIGMGHLSLAKIDRTMWEIEKFRGAEEAKNGLDNCCFLMRDTLNVQKRREEKFDAGDKDKNDLALQETLYWLEKNQLAEKDEFENKQKKLVWVVNCLFTDTENSTLFI